MRLGAEIILNLHAIINSDQSCSIILASLFPLGTKVPQKKAETEDLERGCHRRCSREGRGCEAIKGEEGRRDCRAIFDGENLLLLHLFVSDHVEAKDDISAQQITSDDDGDAPFISSCSNKETDSNLAGFFTKKCSYS